MTTAIERNIRKKTYPGFLLRAALFFLTLAVLATVRLPAQVRGYAYELYREAARANVELKARNLPTLDGSHIRVKYQESDRPYAEMVLEASEKFYSPIAKKYGLKVNRKITVMVYPSREALNASFGWPASESAMGVYWVGVIRVLSPATWIQQTDPQEMQEVFVSAGPMAHEITHLAVDYATRGNCPRWLTEGLAQLEEYRLTGFRFPDPLRSSEQVYSLEQMDRDFDNLEDQSLAYRESLSVVEYMVSVYGEDKLKEILALLGNGRSIEDSVEQVLGLKLVELERNWQMSSGF